MFRENRANNRRENFPPIRWAYHQLPTKTGHLQRVFQRFSRVRSTESSGVMERAMGIEPTSEAWEASILPLYDARSAALNSKRTGVTRTSASFTKKRRLSGGLSCESQCRNLRDSLEAPLRTSSLTTSTAGHRHGAFHGGISPYQTLLAAPISPDIPADPQPKRSIRNKSEANNCRSRSICLLPNPSSAVSVNPRKLLRER